MADVRVHIFSEIDSQGVEVSRDMKVLAQKVARKKSKNCWTRHSPYTVTPQLSK
jgi:hypothetical protein